MIQDIRGRFCVFPTELQFFARPRLQLGRCESGQHGNVYLFQRLRVPIRNPEALVKLTDLDRNGRIQSFSSAERRQIRERSSTLWSFQPSYAPPGAGDPVEIL